MPVTRNLYLAVITAVLLGVALGLVAPKAAVEPKPLGTAFVNLGGVGFILGIDRFMSEARALTEADPFKEDTLMDEPQQVRLELAGAR